MTSLQAASLIWTDGGAAVGPEAGVVELWWVDIAGAPSGAERKLLDDHEHQRAAAFRRDRDRHRYIRARAALRRILGRYARVEPSALPIVQTQHGKPHLAQPQAPTFNLSHSEDVALLALAPDGAIGIDVEVERSIEDVEQLARRFLCADEAEAVCTSAAAERDRRFQICWTRKEAVLKACGLGLLVDTQTIAVGTEATTMRLLATGAEGAGLELTLMSLVPAPGFVAALAVESAFGTRALRCYRESARDTHGGLDQ